MDSLRLIMSFSFSCILLHLASLTIAQTDFWYQECGNDVGNYTTNSNFQRNLNSLLSSLDSNTQIDYGFYNLSVGQTGPDQANAIALCRGDIGVDECRNCIGNSTRKILQVCPNQKEAFGVYDTCMLRYSNRSIFGVMEASPRHALYTPQNATDMNQFNRALQTLFRRLRNTAALGNSIRKFATGNEGAGFDTIYGLAQCTPDLSDQQCDSCLAGAIQWISSCCRQFTAAKVPMRSCNLRYNISRFFGSVTPAAPPVPSPPPAEGKKSNKARTIIITVIPTVSVVILIICICIFLRIRKPKEKVETLYDIEDVELLQLNFSTVRAATDNFSEDNKLGQGGFGAVYKGTLPNGQEIAVKRLSRSSEQGELEFKKEVILVAKLQHRNLVRLQGFCFEKEERLLVYEFLPNSSLNNFIFDPVKRLVLDWEKSYKIITSIARGLLYLHEDSRLRIIHRDLKASNILLDAEMNPKIADFGMARLFAANQTQDNTNRVVGTFGYMAPEYITRGHFSMKSDVFSFGVLVLEIVSGKKNYGCRIGDQEEDLLTYSWRNWNEGTALDIIDPTLNVGSRSEMMRCIHIGLLCVQENEALRPTMAQVSLMLSSYSVTPAIPSKPAFFMHSERSAERLPSLEYDPMSNNEVTISELNPR